MRTGKPPVRPGNLETQKDQFIFYINATVYFNLLKYTPECDIIRKTLFGDMSMDYLTVKEVGEKWGVTKRMVALYCVAGRIEGAVKKGNLWLIPKDAPKPADGRRKK